MPDPKLHYCLPAALFAVALLAIPAVGQEHPFLSTVPENPDPSLRYVIYLHGQIIEAGDRRPTSPQFGVYEYDEILNELGGPGTQVISEQRAPNTGIDAFAHKTAEQVQSLLDHGVPPTHVAVVGFSKGGRIAIGVSSILREPITYVFLAACNTGVFNDERYEVSGRVLSIHEESDDIGISCEPLIERSPAIIEARELLISTGERHGAFYRPRPEWLRPTLRWIARGS